MWIFHSIRSRWIYHYIYIYIYIKRKNREKDRVFQAKLFDMTTNKVQLTDTGSGGSAEVEQVSVARLEPSSPTTYGNL